MRTKFDLTNANALIDDYLKTIRDPDQMAGKHGRTWLEFLMQKHGIIPDVRQLAFMEAHAIWFACLVLSDRVREVSKAEIDTGHARRPRTTERSIKRCMSLKYTAERDSHAARLLNEILNNQNPERNPVWQAVNSFLKTTPVKTL